jgi:hypothetical protein
MGSARNGRPTVRAKISWIGMHPTLALCSLRRGQGGVELRDARPAEARWTPVVNAGVKVVLCRRLGIASTSSLLGPIPFFFCHPEPVEEPAEGISVSALGLRSLGKLGMTDSGRGLRSLPFGYAQGRLSLGMTEHPLLPTNPHGRSALSKETRRYRSITHRRSHQ